MADLLSLGLWPWSEPAEPMTGHVLQNGLAQRALESSILERLHEASYRKKPDV
jgi:hypothetical protein